MHDLPSGARADTSRRAPSRVVVQVYGITCVDDARLAAGVGRKDPDALARFVAEARAAR